MTSGTSLPYVSVIIPAFNEERYIRGCLASVFALDWPKDKMEIIVVNNGSTDGTREIVEQMLVESGRGKILEKPGGTIAAVRNYGWRFARGEFLAFLDGDSVVESAWLKEGFALMSSSDNVSCVGFAVAPPASNDSWVERTWYHISSSGKLNGTRNVQWLSSFNLLLRRESFERIGGFDESLVTCEDADLGMRLSEFSYLLFSDSLHVKHLGTVKTIKSFIFKEIWRGQNSLQAWMRSKDKRKGFLSVFFPVCYTLFLIINVVFGIATTLTGQWGGLLFISLPILVFLPFLLAWRAGVRAPCTLLSTTLLFGLYLLSRGFAIVRF